MATMVWKGQWHDHTIEVEMLSEEGKTATKYQYRLLVDCRELVRERRVGWQNLVVLRKQTALDRDARASQFRAEVRISKGGSEEEEASFAKAAARAFCEMIADLNEMIGARLIDPESNKPYREDALPYTCLELIQRFNIRRITMVADRDAGTARPMTANEYDQMRVAFPDYWPDVEKQWKSYDHAEHYWLSCKVTVDDEAVDVKPEGDWIL